MAKGWLGQSEPAVGEDREHVAAHGVGVERRREGRAGGGYLGAGHHRVHHLRRHEHRHRGPLALVALEVGVERLVEQVAHQGAQLGHVLHAVGALPLRAAPLLLGDVAPAGQPPPVRLDELDPAVAVRLPLRGGVEGILRGLLTRKHLGHPTNLRDVLPLADEVTAGFAVCTLVSVRTVTSSPVGLHRVVEPRGVLPQAAWRLDPDPAVAPDEVRVRVERLNLDAAQLPSAVRQARRRRRRRPRPRSSRSSVPAARCTTRSPARAACSSGPSRRPAPRARSASRRATASPPSSR